MQTYSLVAVTGVYRCCACGHDIIAVQESTLPQCPKCPPPDESPGGLAGYWVMVAKLGSIAEGGVESGQPTSRSRAK